MKLKLLSAAGAVALSACAAQAASLDGLWVGLVTPDKGTPVAIDVSNTDAPLTSNSLTATTDGQQLTLGFDDSAVYLGNMSEPGDAIRGYYIQPGNNYGGQRLAHWVDLESNGDGQWSGEATPLARDFTIFMNISKREADSFKATFLNPQRNITGPKKSYDVAKGETETAFTLSIPEGGQEFTTLNFDEASEKILMDFGPIQGFEFSPVSKRDTRAIGYFGEENRAALTPPSADGVWPVGTPEAAGFDVTKLSHLSQSLASASGETARPALVHSLLVARGGKLVVEEYYRNYAADTPHDLRSAGKTFTSILVGALIQDGVPISADTPINTYISMPNEGDGAPITIGHLLTHQSGLDCYDGDRSTAGHEDVMWQQEDTPNLWEFTSTLGVVAPPGTQYAYCSGGMNLVGAALSGASGESVMSLLQSRIFEPLGFKRAYWNVAPNDEAYLGGGGYIRPRDFLKIGQLYNNGGRWGETQIVDAQWVKESVKKQIVITPETTGLSEDQFNNFYFGGADGYAWHLHTITVDGTIYDTYEASGNGGQIVVVVPALDLVVSLTGGNYMEGSVWGKWRQEIVGDGIIAALKTP